MMTGSIAAIIVVIADHGEELGERGLFNHRLSLSSAVTHVPLMIRMPDGAGAGTRVSAQVGLIDVMPTLLEVAGAAPPAGLQGDSLLSAIHGSPAQGREVVFTEGLLRMVSATTPGGRLIFSGMGADSPWLAETLASARLDGPAFEVEGTLSLEEQARLRDELVAWRAGLVLGGENGAELSEEQIRSLQQGGYWQ